MAAKTKEVIITKKCRVEGNHQNPGDHVELPVHDANYLVAIERATFDLKWTPEAEPEKKNGGKGKGKGNKPE